MVAWALWTVHCTADWYGERAEGCWHHMDECETKAEAHRVARTAGWQVTRDGNLCPACLKLRRGE